MVLLDLLHIQRAGFFKFLKSGLNEELSQLNINIENTRLEILPFADSKSFTDKQLSFTKTYKGATTIKQTVSTSQITTPYPSSIPSPRHLLYPCITPVPLYPVAKGEGVLCDLSFAFQRRKGYGVISYESPSIASKMHSLWIASGSPHTELAPGKAKESKEIKDKMAKESSPFFAPLSVFKKHRGVASLTYSPWTAHLLKGYGAQDTPLSRLSYAQGENQSQRKIQDRWSLVDGSLSKEREAASLKSHTVNKNRFSPSIILSSENRPKAKGSHLYIYPTNTSTSGAQKMAKGRIKQKVPFSKEAVALIDGSFTPSLSDPKDLKSGKLPTFVPLLFGHRFRLPYTKGCAFAVGDHPKGTSIPLCTFGARGDRLWRKQAKEGVRGYRSKQDARISSPHLGKEKEKFIDSPIVLPEREQVEKIADNITSSKVKNACFCLIAPKYTPREAILYQKSWSCKLVVKVLLTVHTENKAQRLEQQVGDNKLTHTSSSGQAETKGSRGSKKPKDWTTMLSPKGGQEERKEGKIFESELPLKNDSKNNKTKIASPITKDKSSKDLPIRNASPVNLSLGLSPKAITPMITGYSQAIRYFKASDESVLGQGNSPLKDLQAKRNKLTHMVVKDEKGYRCLPVKENLKDSKLTPYTYPYAPSPSEIEDKTTRAPYLMDNKQRYKVHRSNGLLYSEAKVITDGKMILSSIPYGLPKAKERQGVTGKMQKTPREKGLKKGSSPVSKSSVSKASSKQQNGHELFLVLGELPLMTKRGHFIINGSPRVILSQLIRTPGIYFTERDNELQADCVPEQGPWLCISKNFRDSSSHSVVGSNVSSIANSQSLPDSSYSNSKRVEGVDALLTPSPKESEAKKGYALPSVVEGVLPVSRGEKGDGLGREAKTKSLSSYFCYTKQFSSMPFSLIYSNFRTFELHSQFTDQTLLLTKLRTLEKIRQLRELITTLLTFTWKKRTRKRLQKLYTKRCFTATQQFEKTKIIFRLKRKLILGSLGRKSFNEKLAVSNCDGLPYTELAPGKVQAKNIIDFDYLDLRFSDAPYLMESEAKKQRYKVQGQVKPSALSAHKESFNPLLSYLKFPVPKTKDLEVKVASLSPKVSSYGNLIKFVTDTEGKLKDKPHEKSVLPTDFSSYPGASFLPDSSYSYSNSKGIERIKGVLPVSFLHRRCTDTPSTEGKVILSYGLPYTELAPGSASSIPLYPYNHGVRGTQAKERARSKNNLKLSPNVLSEGDLLSQDLSLIVRFLDSYKIMPKDDIDDLNNQRVRTSSDQVQQQVRVGCLRFRKMFIKLVRESWGVSQTITDLLNGALREFFGSNPLSQFLDQTNSLAEITHKRRISKLGLGGIQRESATLKVRTIHSTYFGRICPIETPEGVNAGLVNSLTCLSRVNEQGQLVTPLSPLMEKQLQNQFFYYSNQETQPLSTTDTALLKFQRLPNQFIYTKNESHFQQLEVHKVHLRVQSDLQTISLATALIPFLPYDDANRALMGSNMQRQAVPLILPERPMIRTGLESLVISESGHSKESPTGGFVSYVSAQFVIIICHVLNKRALSF